MGEGAVIPTHLLTQTHPSLEHPLKDLPSLGYLIFFFFFFADEPLSEREFYMDGR